MASKPKRKRTLERVIPELAKAVRNRDIRRVLGIVDEWIGKLETLPLSEKGLISLLYFCAWAVDYHEAHLTPVAKALLRFRQIPPAELLVGDLVLLMATEGLVKFHREEYADAQVFFEQLQEDADRYALTEMMIVSRYSLARVVWKQTDYDKALECIRDAMNREQQSNKNQSRLAAMELVKGWQFFLQGKMNRAREVLDRARRRLGDRPKCLLDLGNIISFQGRLYRESGPEHYLQALDCFKEANLIYAKENLGHRNIARTHLNAGLVYRLMARDLARKPPSADSKNSRREVQTLRQKAFEELELARAIYNGDPTRHTRGLGKLHNSRALLFLDSREFDEAEKETEMALEFGRKRNDLIVMADAKTIQSTIALERSNGFGAQSAFKLAREAIDLANQTEHRRLRARAYIREGRALLDPPFNDPIGAERSLNEAQAHVVDDDQDYLRASLVDLAQRIHKRPRSSYVSSTTVADMERYSLEKYTLKRILAEREEQIIRFVFERCDRIKAKAARELNCRKQKVTRATQIFKITQAVLDTLERLRLDDEVLEKLALLKNKEIQGQAVLRAHLKKCLGSLHTDSLESKILKHVSSRSPEPIRRARQR